MESKFCIACKEILPITEFYFRKEKGVYRGACKKCKRVKTKEEVMAVANSQTKTCKHCGLEKSIDDFQKAGGGKYTQPYCKPCDAERKKQHRIKNIEKNKEREKKYYQDNREKILLKEKERKESTRQARKEAARLKREAKKMTEEERKLKKRYYGIHYRAKNKEKVIRLRREWGRSSKGRERAKQNQARKMSDPEFRLLKNMRGRIYVALKRGVKSEGTMKLLGCSISDFKKHFESKFTEGMSWEKYLEGGIHIDHIIPCKSFDLTDPEQQKICFHYSNLQPLWALDNLIKGTKSIEVWMMLKK